MAGNELPTYGPRRRRIFARIAKSGNPVYSTRIECILRSASNGTPQLLVVPDTQAYKHQPRYESMLASSKQAVRALIE